MFIVQSTNVRRLLRDPLVFVSRNKSDLTYFRFIIYEEDDALPSG